MPYVRLGAYNRHGDPLPYGSQMVNVRYNLQPDAMSNIEMWEQYKEARDREHWQRYQDILTDDPIQLILRLVKLREDESYGDASDSEYGEAEID